MRDVAFSLAMILLLVGSCQAMNQWYEWAAEENVRTPLFSLVLFAILVAGVALEVALAIWWLS